jgi:hypothetical protein
MVIVTKREASIQFDSLTVVPRRCRIGKIIPQHRQLLLLCAKRIRHERMLANRLVNPIHHTAASYVVRRNG